ncbi:MAG: alpha/beta fold hydrolase [Polyangiaceae bacterium]
MRLEIAGEGPSVLLLHGTPSAWDVLRPLAAACGQRRVLIAALPGYGGTPAWPVEPTADDFAEALEASLASASTTRLSIVGFSGGAYHALHVASRGKVHVDAVVTLGGFADLSAEERAGMKGFADALRSGAPLDGVPTARFLSPTFARAHPAACQRVESWLHATSRENLARELLMFSKMPSVLPGLATFAGRIVARVGALDLAAPPAHSEAIARASPHSVMQIVEGAGHALMEEDLNGTIETVRTTV